MNKARKIAIAGATGMVGQSFLKLLEKDYFQDSEISLLASSNSAGKEINFRGKNHKVEDLSKFNFSEFDLALFSAGSSVASTYAPIAASLASAELGPLLSSALRRLSPWGSVRKLTGCTSRI